ncbi:hypothetical protein IW262DRAFT_1297943 [Armillaria fumosa]|nr:hypothetical protein IW262DRAFT_1297943 [Armillaria fumosa]
MTLTFKAQFLKTTTSSAIQKGGDLGDTSRDGFNPFLADLIPAHTISLNIHFGSSKLTVASNSVEMVSPATQDIFQNSKVRDLWRDDAVLASTICAPESQLSRRDTFPSWSIFEVGGSLDSLGNPKPLPHILRDRKFSRQHMSPLEHLPKFSRRDFMFHLDRCSRLSGIYSGAKAVREELFTTCFSICGYGERREQVAIDSANTRRHRCMSTQKQGLARGNLVMQYVEDVGCKRRKTRMKVDCIPRGHILGDAGVQTPGGGGGGWAILSQGGVDRQTKRKGRRFLEEATEVDADDGSNLRTPDEGWAVDGNSLRMSDERRTGQKEVETRGRRFVSSRSLDSMTMAGNHSRTLPKSKAWDKSGSSAWRWPIVMIDFLFFTFHSYIQSMYTKLGQHLSFIMIGDGGWGRMAY